MQKKQIVMAVVAVAAVATAGVFAMQGQIAARDAKRDLQYSYDRAIDDLRSSVDNIALTLQKSTYANTPTQQNGLAARLMRECSMAKGSLAVLPVTNDTMNSVSKYISQVGDFSMTLSNRISSGGAITDSEYKTISTLDGYANKLSQSLSNVKLDTNAQKLNDQFKETAKDFTDFPSLIYDGPFSDHIGRQSPRMIEGSPEVSQLAAQSIAAAFLNVSQDQLHSAGEVAGGLPAFNFTAGNTEISVTKAGGVVYSLLNSRDITSEKISREDAQKRALTFVAQRGFSNMEPTYWVLQDGKYIFNLAYTENNIRCYPDLIKVSVAADTGEIVEYNATGYVMNHHTRNLSAPKLQKEAAQKKVSPRLKVNSARPALIPTAGLNEVLCWEFQCTGAAGDQVLVYLNGETGLEEQILIVQQSDTGVLVK